MGGREGKKGSVAGFSLHLHYHITSGRKRQERNRKIEEKTRKKQTERLKFNLHRKGDNQVQGRLLALNQSQRGREEEE